MSEKKTRRLGENIVTPSLQDLLDQYIAARDVLETRIAAERQAYNDRVAAEDTIRKLADQLKNALDQS